MKFRSLAHHHAVSTNSMDFRQSRRQHTSILPLAAAVSFALMQMTSTAAHAQTAPAAPAVAEAKTASEKVDKADKAGKGTLSLDAVVVTASPQGVSKIKSSVSVSTLDEEQLQRSQATSAAEILRSIPGVRSESSGGESNANVTVRGLPISAGGGRYVQFQEDGLPILQFGDLDFATQDTFVRLDGSLDRLEVVRGGSASTLATNAPGGIFNFISKTGEDKGGSIGFSRGIGYDQTRLDFDVGGRLGDKTRYFLGGFYRYGEGARNGGVNVENGGQVRGNITQEFKEGYVRVSFKVLDDHAPTYLPTPVRYVNGQIQTIPGLDPRKTSFYSPYWVADNTLTVNNGRVNSNINDGLTAKSTTFGIESKVNVGDGWNLDEKFRTATNKGRFIAVFPGDDVANVTTTYATGPNRGQAYTGPAFTAVVFNTSLDNLDLTANDLKLAKKFAIDNNSSLTATGGFYTSLQNVGLTWNFNQYLLQATGDKPAILTSAINGTNGFGGCCSVNVDAQYKTTAPYAVLAYETGPINLDASVRSDKQKVNGTYNQLVFAPANSLTYDPTAARIINYEKSHTSYSFGGNYRVDKDLAFFARYSEGVAFNADRIVNFSAQKAVDGTSPIPINTVKQFEAGVKWRVENLSTFVTLFQAKTSESNYDLISRKSSANTYDAKGAELEMAYNIGGFRLAGGATITDANITASNTPSLVGQTPRRQAKLIYQISPSYSIGDFTIGGSIIGTSASKDDSPTGPISVTLPAYSVINAFATYNITSSLLVTLGANNLLDKIGYTESNDGRGAARSINGRAVKLGLKYTF